MRKPSYVKQTLLQILSTEKENRGGTFWTFCQSQETSFPATGVQGEERRLNEKVSSAVFRAWTDKQREFYVAAKCNLTLQTSFIHWNIPDTRHHLPGI